MLGTKKDSYWYMLVFGELKQDSYYYVTSSIGLDWEHVMLVIVTTVSLSLCPRLTQKRLAR